jgi:hypothetical protein
MNPFEWCKSDFECEEFFRFDGLLGQEAGFQQEMGLGRPADIWLCYAGQGRDFSL